MAPYHTGAMVKAYARPELLASPEWLADHLDRPEIRLVDVRWRPDGTGRAAYEAGHIPGAAYLDWVTELVEPDDDASLFLLGGPEQVAAAAKFIHPDEMVWVVVGDRAKIEKGLSELGMGAPVVLDPDGNAAK